MYGFVINNFYPVEKYVDHYLKLNIDNSEIVKLLRICNAPKECVREYDDLPCELITRNYRYYDRYGNYWDNWIGKETIIDL